MSERAKCCYEGCDREAAFHVHGSRGRADDYTHACPDHLTEFRTDGAEVFLLTRDGTPGNQVGGACVLVVSRAEISREHPQCGRVECCLWDGFGGMGLLDLIVLDAATTAAFADLIPKENEEAVRPRLTATERKELLAARDRDPAATVPMLLLVDAARPPGV